MILLFQFFLRTIILSTTIYLIYNYNSSNLFFIISILLLFGFDIISYFFPFYHFQFIFIIFFIISLIYLFNYSNLFYAYLFLFYSVFKSFFYIYYYNCIIVKNNYNKELLEYLEKFEDVLGENEECYICLENKNEKNGLKYLNCSHIFHPSCLLEWYNSQKFENFTNYLCPVCKKNIFSENENLI